MNLTLIILLPFLGAILVAFLPSHAVARRFFNNLRELRAHLSNKNVRRLLIPSTTCGCLPPSPAQDPHPDRSQCSEPEEGAEQGGRVEHETDAAAAVHG